MTDPATRDGEERAPWVLARDAAVLALLYGAGLRIGEALGLTRAEAPVGGQDGLTVTGKGRKTRMVPVIAPVRPRHRGLSRALPPSPCPARGRSSSACAAGRCRRASSS